MPPPIVIQLGTSGWNSDFTSAFAGSGRFRLTSPLPLAGRGRGWGELGFTLDRGTFEFVYDAVHHALYVVVDIAVPDAKDTEPLSDEVGLPAGIMLALLGAAVGRTVDLEDEAVRQADEIDDVAVDGRLLSELESSRLQSAQMPPELRLGAGPSLAQGACALVGHYPLLPGGPPPMTPPRKGEGKGRRERPGWHACSR